MLLTIIDNIMQKNTQKSKENIKQAVELAMKENKRMSVKESDKIKKQLLKKFETRSSVQQQKIDKSNKRRNMDESVFFKEKEGDFYTHFKLKNVSNFFETYTEWDQLYQRIYAYITIAVKGAIPLELKKILYGGKTLKKYKRKTRKLFKKYHKKRHIRSPQ